MITERINQRLSMVVAAWASGIAREVMSEYAMLDFDGEYDLHVVTGQIYDALTVTFIGTGQKALIGEYGSGSLMDTSNPNFQGFLDSDFFNSLRNKHRTSNGAYPITGRAAGSYENLDGETEESSGKMAGLNLERPLHKGRSKYQPLEPEPPRHLIYNAIEENLDYLVEDIAQVLAEESLDYLVEQLSATIIRL